MELPCLCDEVLRAVVSCQVRKPSVHPPPGSRCSSGSVIGENGRITVLSCFRHRSQPGSVGRRDAFNSLLCYFLFWANVTVGKSFLHSVRIYQNDSGRAFILLPYLFLSFLDVSGVISRLIWVPGIICSLHGFQ